LERSLSKIKKIATALVAVIVLSVFILLWVPATYYPTYIIKAGALYHKPDSFMLIENPDVYVSQAISNMPERIFVRSLDVTDIDELISQQMWENKTSNFQINGDYYQIGIVCVDAFPPVFLSYMFLLSHITLPTSVVALTIIAIFVIVKRNKK